MFQFDCFEVTPSPITKGQQLIYLHNIMKASCIGEIKVCLH